MAGGARFRDFGWRPLGRRTPVIAGLDLTIEPGERLLVAGPSGSGKSTLLHALAGALGTTLAGEQTGSVEVDGRVGLLLQNPADAVVAERVGRDVAFGPENLGLDRAAIWARVDEALEKARLPYPREHFTAALSGGETQRLALAGVLAVRPDIFLLDEPTAMLDDDHAASVREAVVAASSGATLIVVEHRIAPWLDHVDRVVVLSQVGTVVSDTGVAAFRDGPPPPGVWMPDLPAPEPLGVSAELVDPVGELRGVAAHDVSVDLVTRTLRGTQRTLALQAFSARLVPGSLTAFVGPSGSGKSTALATLAGLLRPTAGATEPALRQWTSRQLASDVGWVPQDASHGFLTSSVSDEVAATARRLGRPVDVDAILRLLRLEHLAAASPHRLSGGEQRRLALAAALAHRPGVVLLDEPTVGQDRDGWGAVVGWLLACRGAGAAVAVTTHDAALAAVSDTVVRLDAGSAA